MNNLPIKRTKNVLVQARACEDDVRRLKRAKVNIPELIREAILEAVSRLDKMSAGSKK